MNTVIISDFHMCAGVDPETGLTSQLEDFTHDHVFESFLSWLEKREEAPWHLIIAGDLFDYQQVTVLPTLEELKHFRIPVYRDDLDKRWLRKSKLQRKSVYYYEDFAEASITNLSPVWDIDTRVEGLGTEEESVLFKTHRIIEGHRRFFQSIARFVASGNKMTVLRGNHDVELAWESSQELIRERCGGFVPSQKDVISKGLHFAPAFYYEKDRLYVEHGQQAEGTTAIRHIYTPFIHPKKSPGRVIELDFSSFLVRYLMNRVENINPLADNIRPRKKYFTWLIREHPAQAIWIVGAVLPKVIKLWKKFIAPPGVEEAARENEERMKKNAAHLGIPEAAACAVDALKDPPTLPRGWRYMIMKVVFGLGIITVSTAVIIAVLASLAYTLGIIPGVTGLSPYWQNVIDIVTWIFVYPVITLVVLLPLLYLLGRRRERSDYTKSPIDSGPSPGFRGYVSGIAEALKKENASVRYIVTGHTHYGDRFEIEPGCRYFNTGTWMFLLNPKEQVFREKFTYSFVEILNDRAELRQFEPSTGTARDMVVEA